MKNLRIILVLAIVLFQCCGMSDRKKANETRIKKVEAVSDSMEFQRKIQLEKAKALKDSISLSEQKIAIGGILFDISQKEFKLKKGSFLKSVNFLNLNFIKMQQSLHIKSENMGLVIYMDGSIKTVCTTFD